ncbi:PfkB family carbohydrate kinase [Microbacterium sp. NPDC064584]|uniref:PfkB family carbohydrate kinase n=1 Tax=Microbacterium sp. NPDC064584 TaxID=3155817 RepID=UPI003432093D
MTAPILTVVGATNADHVVRVQRMPRPGETVADGVLVTQAGGKGANQAVAAARLGARARLVSAVGADAAGIDLLSGLRASGVDTDGVQVVDDATGTAIVVVDSTGENSIVVCRGANGRIDPSAVRIEHGSAMLAQLEVDSEIVETAALACTGLVVLNPSPAQPLSARVRERVDLFIVNEGEYDALAEIHTAPLVALTLGAEGARILRRGRLVASAPSVAARVVSTVGAGDAFAAALTVALLRGIAHEEALRAACRVGAAAVADPRSQPMLDRLQGYLDPAS